MAGAVGPGAVGAGEVGFGVAGVGVDGLVWSGLLVFRSLAWRRVHDYRSRGRVRNADSGSHEAGDRTSGCEAFGMTPPSIDGTLLAPLPALFDDRSLFGVDVSKVPLVGEELLEMSRSGAEMLRSRTFARSVDARHIDVGGTSAGR